jgi:hypothetical protein
MVFGVWFLVVMITTHDGWGGAHFGGECFFTVAAQVPRNSTARSYGGPFTFLRGPAFL